MAAQWFCFHVFSVRLRNIEPGLNSSPGFLPSKSRAASGRGVQTCWGGYANTTRARSQRISSQAQQCLPSTVLRTLSGAPAIKNHKNSLKPTWICYESVDGAPAEPKLSTESEGHSPGLSYSSQKSCAVQDAMESSFCSVQRGHSLTALLGQNAAAGKGRHKHHSDATLRLSMTPSAPRRWEVWEKRQHSRELSSLSEIKL